MLHLLSLLPLLVAAHAPPGYKHVGGDKGVQVYRQEKSPAIDLYAEGDIAAPPSLVRQVLLDYPNAHALSDHVSESRILQIAPREMLVYQRLKLPIVSDRDFGLKATWGQNGDALWTRFTVDNSKSPKPKGGVVRVSVMQGGWDLQPINDGTATHAVYHVQIDMAGSIPKWMVSGGAAKDIPKLFEGVRKQSRMRSQVASSKL